MANEHPSPLVEAIKNRNCVIFFGSGISRDSGLPTGDELIERLFDIAPNTGVRGYDLARIAQIQRHKHRQINNWLMNRLQNVLEDHNGPNDLHRLLVMLNSKYYVTTNYDRLFDKVLRDQIGVKDLPIIVTDADLTKAGEVIYIKLHGDIYESDSIVLTYNDYESKFENNPNLLHLLYALFAQNVILFLGYSLRDPNILSIVRKIGQKGSRGMYIVLADPREDDIIFFESLNVQVIPLDLSAQQQNGECLRQWLLELWNKAISEASYDLYLSTIPKELPYETQIPLAVQIYNAGNYAEAAKLFQTLFEHPKSAEYWRKHPDLFGQVAYYGIKALDKLNDWRALNARRLAIIEKLKNLQELYGSDIAMLISNQINASVGTALMRFCRYEDAYAVLKEALAFQPIGYPEREGTGPLLADRYTVLASICLCRALLSPLPDALALLKESKDAFSEAGNIFGKLKLSTPESDNHYLGRFNGTNVFLQIGSDIMGVQAIVDPDQLLKDAIRAHAGNRKAYGIVAGKYCDGTARFFLGLKSKQSGDKRQAEIYFNTAEMIWQDCLHTAETSQLSLSALDYCKLYTALHRLTQERGDEQNWQPLQSELDIKRKLLLEEDFPQDVILHENWIFTPLN